MNFPTEEEARAARDKSPDGQKKEELVKPKPPEAEKPPAPPPKPAQKPPEPLAEATVRQATPPKPQKPIRPEDISDWKRDDYYSAKRDNDPRLVEAVAYLGRRFIGNENAAILLAKLLEAPTDDPFLSGNREDNNRRPENDPADKLPPAIIAALALNNTPHAQRTLEQLVTGSLKTVSPQLAAQAALKALLAHPHPKSEELLLNLLLDASSMSEDEHLALDMNQLQQAAVEPIRAVASESFRTRLAKRLLGPDLSQETFNHLWPCLKDPKPENLPAQILFYQGGRLNPKDHEELQERLIERSGLMLDALLGIGPSTHGASSAVARHASLFWNADFATSIQRQLRSQTSIEKMGDGLARMAVTLPNPEIRAAMLRFLEKHWEEGPKGLLPANSQKPVVLEPGFLAILKMLPHKNSAAAGNGRDKPVKVDNRFMASTKAAKITEARETKQRQEKISQEWADFTRGITQSMCKKFQSASKSGNIDDAGLAFKLAPRATIVGVYRLDWPEDLGNAVIAPPTLRVRYVRTEQKAMPSKVTAYYRRQLSEWQEHAFPGGIWTETIATDKSDGILRSTDVLISKATSSSEMNDQEQELIVEILTIECGAAASPNTLQQRQ